MRLIISLTYLGILLLDGLRCSSSGSGPTAYMNWTEQGQVQSGSPITPTLAPDGTLVLTTTMGVGNGYNELVLKAPNTVGTYEFSTTATASATYTANNQPGTTTPVGATYFAGSRNGTLIGNGNVVIYEATSDHVSGGFSFSAVDAASGAVKEVSSGGFYAYF